MKNRDNPMRGLTLLAVLLAGNEVGSIDPAPIVTVAPLLAVLLGGLLWSLVWLTARLREGQLRFPQWFYRGPQQ